MQGKFIDDTLYAIPDNQNRTVIFDVDSNMISYSDFSLEELEKTKNLTSLHSSKIKIDIPKSVQRNIDYVIVGVAETCNLRCTYCYAEGGTYGQKEKKIMSYEELKEMLFKLIEISPSGIQCFSFFGGEPLMGFEAIKEFVEFASVYLPQHDLPIPRWGIVTNGTLMTDEIIEFFNRHNFSVNVSLDGPKEINDRTRIFTDPTKSVYDVVEKNLKDIKNRTFILSCQATLNRDFFLDYKKGSYEEFIKALYSLGYDYVAPLIAQCPETAILDTELENKIEEFYKDMIDYDFNLLISGENLNEVSAYTLSIIDRLIKQEYHLGCHAGSQSIYYSAQGKFYPCHLIYELGEPEITKEELKQEKTVKYIDKLESQVCRSCMARNICFSWCPGVDKLLNNKHDESSCFAQKVALEFVILKLVYITEDENLFVKFSRNYKRAAEESAKAEKGIIHNEKIYKKTI